MGRKIAVLRLKDKIVDPGSTGERQKTSLLRSSEGYDITLDGGVVTITHKSGREAVIPWVNVQDATPLLELPAERGKR